MNFHYFGFLVDITPNIMIMSSCVDIVWLKELMVTLCNIFQTIFCVQINRKVSSFSFLQTYCICSINFMHKLQRFHD